MCSACGYKDSKKPFEIQEWTCPICHAYHDCDIKGKYQYSD
ncbi:zinc ribbon domain-containing protein [Lysinibacillus sp. FSL M8-0337]|nr:zinc ribbon domain-containing protein [Lysinibacillus sphaericus]